MDAIPVGLSVVVYAYVLYKLPKPAELRARWQRVAISISKALFALAFLLQVYMLIRLIVVGLVS